MQDEKDSQGWVQIPRSEFAATDPLWSERRPRTSWEALMDLYHLAAHTDHIVYYNRAELHLERGQVPTSERVLAERWRWSRGKVRRFLDVLESARKIVKNRYRDPAHDPAHGLTVLTLCNYPGCGSDEPADGTAIRPTDGTIDSTTDGPPTVPNRRIKEGKEGKRRTTSGSSADGPGGYSADFERAWSLYPKREGGNPKRRAYSAWRARIREGTSAEALITGVERYARYCESAGIVGQRVVMQAATFFGPDERWKDDYTPAASQEERDWRDKTLEWYEKETVV